MKIETMPYREGIDYAVGVDRLTGEVLSLGVVPGPVTSPPGSGGGTAAYNFSLIQSYESLQKAIDMEVEASGRYGLFSAEGKFKFVDQANFNTQSTFLLARVVVENAFKQCMEATLTDPARKLLANNKADVFRQRFGDSYVRGIKDGGEYFALISITSSFLEEQHKIGVALRARYDGLVASGEVSGDFDEETKKMIQRSEINVLTFQRGGIDEGLGFTGNTAEVINRLRDFPKIANANPVPYFAQTAEYTILDLPEGANPIDIQNQREVVEDCMKARFRLLTIKNDLEFIQLHPDFFEGSPDLGKLSEWNAAVTDQINLMTEAASRALNSPSDAEFIPLQLPVDLHLPTRKTHTSKSVIIYRDANWHGTSQELELGARIDDAEGRILIGNDQLSSLKVPQGVTVRAYEHAWFQGAFIDFTEDTPQVPAEWEDRISSLIVRDVTSDPPDIDYIVAADIAWAGRISLLKAGQYPDLDSVTLGSRSLTYLLIPKGFVVRIWEQPEFAGDVIEFVTDTVPLPPEWDNRAASMEVLDLRA
ncbi:hypothetical protein AB0F57_10375 [Streptomyces tanashiensis]|uniref:hypothetical protein n=1 Tax=Streptomyces tanashiensis TaxID=67367 RepID=UPI0033CE8A75